MLNLNNHFKKYTNFYVSLISTLLCLVLMEGILQIAFYYKKKVWLWDQEEYKVGYTVTVNDRRHYSLNPKFLDLKQGINLAQFAIDGYAGIIVYTLI